mmetsp:Transcript_17624/g.33438  ORF Transcript_17624/g.33438 Transcript_17624/m.33438 type:complete len:207 (-) Transcript_17624:82-702(-)
MNWMLYGCCYLPLTVISVTILLWATLTHLSNERNQRPTADGSCPYKGYVPVTVVFRTYWISDYSLSIAKLTAADERYRNDEDDNEDGSKQQQQQRVVVWEPKNMFFVNRVYRENLCLPDVDCFELVIHSSYEDETENQYEFHVDGSYEIWWNGLRKSTSAAAVTKDALEVKMKKKEETFRFGNGCASFSSLITQGTNIGANNVGEL